MVQVEVGFINVRSSMGKVSQLGLKGYKCFNGHKSAF